ncbi:MAG: alpha-D-ribose 1-methylphosphonate 5-triphosphate diphosphatase [Alphaproteobacteria bacterium]|nr:alpha-D-ribose 1-methylphosphonate 5-triphosphate diphosphatase [Alphaproteobacteria bacterium]
MTQTCFSNGKIVLADEIVEGSVFVQNGIIRDIQPARREAPANALDLDGDYLIPGAVDLHTDNLERHVAPRSNAKWPSRSAMAYHDAHCASAGITTVLDSLCVGDSVYEQDRSEILDAGIQDLASLGDAGLLKVNHYLHLRCELPSPNLVEVLDRALRFDGVRLVSLMDHSPGVGQFADPEQYKIRQRRRGFNDAEIAERTKIALEQRAEMLEPNRAALLERVAGRNIVLASHDDRTEEEVLENAGFGITISEFPVTMAAALAAKQQRMTVVTGAPNLVRGGSHTGNVAAADLIRKGAADALASDYVPGSMIEGAFKCAADDTVGLPAAIAMITAAPAQMAGFSDRGAIEIGRRADLVRVRLHKGLPVVVQVWSGGKQVA